MGQRWNIKGLATTKSPSYPKPREAWGGRQLAEPRELRPWNRRSQAGEKASARGWRQRGRRAARPLCSYPHPPAGSPWLKPLRKSEVNQVALLFLKQSKVRVMKRDTGGQKRMPSAGRQGITNRGGILICSFIAWH